MDLEPHLLALIGAATAAAGMGLVAWGAQALGSERSAGTSESLLAPTLAVDILDPDLRVAYMRTLVLDARQQARRTPVAPLGRELRRALIALQARRVRGDEPQNAGDLIALIDEACDAAMADEAGADLLSSWVDTARRFRVDAEELPKYRGGSQLLAENE